MRHRISARFDHDPTQIVTFYMEMQKQYQDRLIETTRALSCAAINQPPNPTLQPTANPLRGLSAAELGLSRAEEWTARFTKHC